MDCFSYRVFILDHSSDINVTNCKKCQIFIGPVDGLACFEGLNHCQIAVACNSFRAKACNSVDFEVLTASGPSIEESTDLRFCAWRATYPELQSQLDKIGLDVKKNAFDKVYDSSLGETPNFSLEEPLVHLEPPEIPRDSVPEEPTETHVPAPAPPAIFTQGSVDFLAGESPLSMAPAENGHASGSVFDAPLENTPLNLSQPPPLDELPTVIAAKEKLKERLAKQETAETKAREELLRNATAFIEDFYKKRTALKTQKAKENRVGGKNAAAKGPEGKTEWERAVNLIDFQFPRSNGADLSRLKSVLFAAKSKGK
eukprot:jgi/Botrbrau1/21433/Bobra.0216s0046.3